MNAMNMATKREGRDLMSRFKAGLLAPAMAQAFLPGDGGTVSVGATFTLDPVAGQVVTPMFAEFTLVYVPVTAIEHLLTPSSDTADIPEVVRQKYLTGADLYGLENETEISKRLGVVPQKIANVQKVCTISRLAYVAACNYLRRQKYAYAIDSLHTSTAIERAILSETVLDKLRGVLDPADQANGQVKLDIGTMSLPVDGFGFVGATTSRGAGLNVRGTTAAQDFVSTAAGGAAGTHMPVRGDSAGGADTGFAIKQTGTSPNVRPNINAIFDGQATGISLVDLYKAENHDKMIRAFAQMVKDNPQDGEEMVMRYVHGMSMEPGRHCVTVFTQKVAFGIDVKDATDGDALLTDTQMSKAVQRIGATVIIPRSELGGILIGVASVKPDETIYMQPHPILSKPWAIRNNVDDETKLDPVPVTMREVDAEVLTANETTVAFYTGLHELERNYQNYGMTRNTNPVDLEDKTAIWQVKIPASVTPENVVYPVIDQYPFIDQLAEICRFRMQWQAALVTKTQFGPTPVEEVDIVAAEGLLT